MRSKLITKRRVLGGQFFRCVTVTGAEGCEYLFSATLSSIASGNHGVFEEFSLFASKSSHVLSGTLHGAVRKRRRSVFSWRSTHFRTSSGECSVVRSSET